MGLSLESYKLECKKTYNTKFTSVIVVPLFSISKLCHGTQVPDSLKMCYLYICTCNLNESVINKFKIKIWNLLKKVFLTKYQVIKY